MKKITALLTILAVMAITATALAEQPPTWPAQGSTATISLAPVAMKDHRGTEFEKGYRIALGEEVPLTPYFALYNDISYTAANRAGGKSDVSIATLGAGIRANLATGALTPYGQLGLGLAYVDQDGELGGNDWRPSYVLGAGITSALGPYRIDLGWQLDTLKVTGGTMGVHTFAVTTHVPLAW